MMQKHIKMLNKWFTLLKFIHKYEEVKQTENSVCTTNLCDTISKLKKYIFLKI